MNAEDQPQRRTSQSPSLSSSGSAPSTTESHSTESLSTAMPIAEIPSTDTTTEDPSSDTLPTKTSPVESPSTKTPPTAKPSPASDPNTKANLSTLPPLPTGWEERRTTCPPKRIYFVDHNTRTSAWDDPRFPPCAVRQYPHITGDEPLPLGWEKKSLPMERVYFVNHAKKETTWRDPRPRYEPVDFSLLF